jgi:hypothetical protein
VGSNEQGGPRTNTFCPYCGEKEIPTWQSTNLLLH